MKKVLVLALVLVLSLAIASVAMADTPAPGGPFNSAFRVQNLGTSEAKCQFVFYDEAGNADFTSAQETIDPGDSWYVYVPIDVDPLDAGTYSAVVSCDQPVAAVTNFSDPNSGASHSGITEPGDTWYAPGIYDNYYNYYSNIVVQNATASPIDITVEIYEPGNPTAVKTQTESNVPAYTSVSFEQEGATEMDTNQFYSAKIMGTGDIAPIVNIYGKAAYDNQLYSYNPFKSGSVKAYAPVIMNAYYGYNTALVIQNMGGSDASVKVTYSNGLEKNYTIKPGAAESLYTPLFGPPAGNTLYSATIESTNAQPLAVLVNESNAYNRAASYSGFASGSTEVSAPIVMRRYYKYNTSVTCQNVGAAAATMTLSYGGVAGSNTSPSIGVGKTHLFLQQTDGLIGDSFIGSATVTSAQDIVCIVNEDMNEGAEALQTMDQLYAYNGIAK
jgi:hypothetical protein